MASLGLWTLPFCSLARSLRRFVALHRFPSSQRPRLSSDGISTEWVLSPLQRRPLQQWASCWLPRTCTWTATLDYVQMTLHLGAMLLGIQDGQNEYARDKRPDLLVLHSASCSATLQRSRPKPHQPDMFAPRYASTLCIGQLRALHFTSTALRAASASLGTTSAPFFGASDQLGIMPQGRHIGIETLDNP